jgi:hypothetical protein
MAKEVFKVVFINNRGVIDSPIVFDNIEAAVQSAKKVAKRAAIDSKDIEIFEQVVDNKPIYLMKHKELNTVEKAFTPYVGAVAILATKITSEEVDLSGEEQPVEK